jgi:heterodisulfide reductase subunit D
LGTSTDTDKKRLEEAFYICQQCGMCTSACGSSQVSDYNARKLVRAVQLEMADEKEFLQKIPWLCSQCGRCHEVCGAGLDIPKLVLGLRQKAYKAGYAPQSILNLQKNILETATPFKSGNRTKTSWLKDAPAPREDAETIFFTGCAGPLMAPNISKAMAEVLTKVAGGYRLLKDELCCGEPLIVVGLLEDAKANAEKLVKAIKDSGAKRVVTACAGCYNALTNLYPNVLGVKPPEGVEIQHFAQFIAKKKDLKLRLEKSMTATYHDPCSLGRHSKVYDPPREVLRSIEGLKLVEMSPNRDRALCCGGGGGLWSVDPNMAMEVAASKFQRSVLPSKAEVLVSGCPTCFINFRFTFLKRKLQVQVMDLAEIVNMALPK